MKKLFVIVALALVSSVSQADQCEDLAQQASSANMSSGQERLKAKYAIQTMQALGCGGGQQVQQEQAAPTQSPPQYVPSIGQWCQSVNGVMNCWK
jgi:hypothetical protein